LPSTVQGWQSTVNGSFFEICMVVITTLWICIFPQHVLWFNDIQTGLSGMLAGKQALRCLDSHSALKNLIITETPHNPSPVPGRVKNLILCLPPTHMRLILSVCHRKRLEKSFLSTWREAKFISILKPDCDHFLTDSYRPANLWF
jgi:hypothetical protein